MHLMKYEYGVCACCNITRSVTMQFQRGCCNVVFLPCYFEIYWNSLTKEGDIKVIPCLQTHRRTGGMALNESSGDCPLFPDNPSHCDVLIAIRRTTGALSLIGSFFMIVVIWLFRKYMAFSQRLILYLSIGAFMDSISYLMGELRPDGPVCRFQAWWLTYFDWTVLLWVCCITFNLYLNVVKMITREKLEWVYHVLCWGLPLIISCLPFAGGHYGPAGAWCWIEENWHWRVGIWYGPLFIAIFALVVVYIYIVYTLRRKASSWQGTYDPDTERAKELMKEDIKPLRAYPFVYLAISIFPLVNRIQNALNNNNPIFPLLVLASLSAPLHGAMNAIVFGMDRETFSRLTPSQIKTAVQNHFAPKAMIQEYEQHEDQEGISY